MEATLTMLSSTGEKDDHESGHNDVKNLTRIKLDPEVMGGKPCIRGTRVTVGTLVGLIAAGRSIEEVLEAYPYLERADVQEALSYAAWRSEEVELGLSSP